MVATLEPITETQIPDIASLTDRPDGRSIYEDSSSFYDRHIDLLSRGHGKVAEVPVNSYAGQRFETHTVVLGTGKDGQHFTWQYTVAHPFQEREGDTRHRLAPVHVSGRRVYQLHSQKDGEPTAWSADYDSTGRLMEVRDLDALEIANLWSNISTLLDSPYAKTEIEKLRAQKKRQYEYLRRFAFTRQVEYERKDFSAQGTDQKTQTRTVRLDGAAYEKERERRDKVIAGFGFAAVKPMARPSR